MKLSIKVTTRVLVVTSLVGMLLMFTMFILTGAKDRKINTVTNNFEYLGTLVDELWNVSQTLTTDARLYVTTRQQKHFDNYNYLLDWRNGNAARPTLDEIITVHMGETISEYELLKKAGASEYELELYKRSIDLSENLAALETQAMQSLKTGRFVPGMAVMKEGESIQDFAVRILFDDVYQGEVAKIKAPLNELYSVFDKRRQDTLANEQKNFIFLNIGTGISMLFLFL